METNVSDKYRFPKQNMFGSLYFLMVLRDNTFIHDRLFQSLLAIAAYSNTGVQLTETAGNCVKTMKKLQTFHFLQINSLQSICVFYSSTNPLKMNTFI